jgi:hypothetical protein
VGLVDRDQHEQLLAMELRTQKREIADSRVRARMHGRTCSSHEFMRSVATISGVRNKMLSCPVSACRTAGRAAQRGQCQRTVHARSAACAHLAAHVGRSGLGELRVDSADGQAEALA